MICVSMNNLDNHGSNHRRNYTHNHNGKIDTLLAILKHNHMFQITHIHPVQQVLFYNTVLLSLKYYS